MLHSRNKITQIIDEYSDPKKSNLITAFSVTGYGVVFLSLSLSLCVFLSPIQIRGMLKHLIDFSTPAHNLLLTDLEFAGFRPGHSQRGINDMSASVRKNSL